MLEGILLVGKEYGYQQKCQRRPFEKSATDGLSPYSLNFTKEI